jgi:transposase InsO family protein
MQVEAAIVEESRRHPRYGYRRVHALIERRGFGCARRTVQRVRRREGLRVLGPARKPRCPARPDAKIKAEGVNDVWCVDLVFDVTRHGVTLKFLTIVDEGSRYCIDMVVGRRMTARDVVRALDEAMRRHGTCAVTTEASSSPRSSRTGCGTAASARASSSPEARGRTASTRASTGAFATNASTGSSLAALDGLM